jgi:hypothetical protein
LASRHCSGNLLPEASATADSPLQPVVELAMNLCSNLFFCKIVHRIKMNKRIYIKILELLPNLIQAVAEMSWICRIFLRIF